MKKISHVVSSTLAVVLAVAIVFSMVAVSYGSYSALAATKVYKGQKISITAPFKSTTFKTTNAKIAKVDKKGVVKFKKPGRVSIVAYDNKTGKKKTYKYRVYACIHEYSKWKVVKQPTCTEEGLAESLCNICKAHKKTKKLKKLDHEGEWETVVEPNLCRPGEMERICTVCGQVETKEIPGDETKHKWYQSNKVNATCSTTGLISYTCSVCGEEKEEVIPVTGEHRWGQKIEEKKATCSAEGINTWYCQDCGEKKTETVPKLEHKWNAGVIKEKATCTEDGYKLFTCSACGATKREKIEATGHTWKDSTVLVAATCNKGGRVKQVCTVCGATREIDTQKTQHTYKPKQIAATCTSGNYIEYKCSICGDTYIADVGEPLGHDWQLTKTVEASITSKGWDVYTCTRCKETKTENEHWYQPDDSTILATLENGKAKSGGSTGKTTVPDTLTGKTKNIDTMEMLSWDSSDYYKWNGGLIDGATYGYGDLAYAMILSDGCFGINPCYAVTDGSIQIGDIVKDETGHYAVVYQIDGDEITLAEANYNNSGLVKWDRVINLSEHTLTVYSRRY